MQNIDLKDLQKRVIDNKIKKGFNTTDLYKEFALTHGELSEALEAYYKKLPDLGEELADVAIYLLGISEILGIDLGSEILKKMEKNEKRKYIKVNGVLMKVEGR